MTWVLVVDDDLYMRRLVERALRDDGLDVRSAANGSEALGSIDGEQPGVIVLDLIMPVMDGRTFFREARNAGVTSPVLILAATGGRKAAAELSADGFLGKPFDPIRLCAAVRELLPSSPNGA